MGHLPHTKEMFHPRLDWSYGISALGSAARSALSALSASRRPSLGHAAGQSDHDFSEPELRSTYEQASRASSKSKTRSIAGRMADIEIDAETSSKPSRLPTEMWRKLAPLPNSEKKSISLTLLLKKPIADISPPGRTPQVCPAPPLTQTGA